MFPTVHHLARAREDVVMKVWQGLGYYSRARNLHATAKYISKELRGKFPNDFEEIKKLKGIGDYTAGAIASLAFNKPHVVVDGNVFRVLSRYFGIKTPIDSSEGKKEFTRLAQKLIDKKDPGTFNQGVMEFGALQCVPVSPDCSVCVLKRSCLAYKKDRVNVLPLKSKKTKIRTRHFNYFVVRDKGRILIRKRTEKDIWRGLYDFPMVETGQEISLKEMKKLVDFPVHNTSKPVKHNLSHQVILARFWESDKRAVIKQELNKGAFYINENQLDRYAFPRLIGLYFEKKLRRS